MKIRTILDQIDLGSIALPEFQRGFVWNRDQVRGLMHSLYHRHPVGSLLVWITSADTATARGSGQLAPGVVKLLLDGQQRMTCLYGIARGRPPKFFDGNAQAFTGLHFHLKDEVFEFYASMKMKGNPLWIDVKKLVQNGAGDAIKDIVTNPEFQADLTGYIDRVNRISGILDVDLHIEEVTGEDKSVDVVVDIFNRVNSGGTKLSKGDLALAKICASWPEARDEMKERLEKWENAGFNFRIEWLLRCVNAVLTGEALFSALKTVEIDSFQKGLATAEKMIDKLLNLIASRLGLDHDRVLGGRYSFPVLARYFSQKESQLSEHKERDKLLYWYIHTFLWGRYAGSTESILNQDLHLIEETDGALERLIEQLRRNRGDLRLNAEDFRGWSRSARFYPLLYMLTRVWHAKDWGTGIELSAHLLGAGATLHLHHIFPKSLLYDAGYPRSEVNAIANFTFLTQETNLAVSNRQPSEYFEEYAKNIGVVESHWIPMDRELWKIKNYPYFLEARRELLAKAANEFLGSLVSGVVPDEGELPSVLERERPEAPGGIESEEERRLIEETNEWLIKLGLPPGQVMYELVDPHSGEPLAILDLAWPDGIQEGFSQPVALLIDEDRETQHIINQMGYRHFMDPNTFRSYVHREILAMEDAV